MDVHLVAKLPPELMDQLPGILIGVGRFPDDPHDEFAHLLLAHLELPDPLKSARFVVDGRDGDQVPAPGHDELLEPPLHPLKQRILPSTRAPLVRCDRDVHGPVADEGADEVGEVGRDHLPHRARPLDRQAVLPDQLDDTVLGEDVVMGAFFAFTGKDGLFGVPIPGEDPALEDLGQQAPLPGVEVLGPTEDGLHGRERFDLVLAHVAGEYHGRRGIGVDEPGTEPADPVDVGGQGLLGHEMGGHDQPPAKERLPPAGAIRRRVHHVPPEDDAAVGEPVADAVPLDLHERPLLCPGGAPLVVEPHRGAGGTGCAHVLERRLGIVSGF